MKIFLNVPYHEKDIAKKSGAKWSPGHKSWYVENKEDLRPFMVWIDARLKKPCKTLIAK